MKQEPAVKQRLKVQAHVHQKLTQCYMSITAHFKKAKA